MPVPRAVTNWIEDAEARHGPTFDAWAPEGFDWEAFCADAPRFADELGETWVKATEPAARVRLEELAVAAFRGAYVGAIAFFAAFDAARDPDEALARLVLPLDDEEGEAFEAALADDLGPVEAALGADLPPSDSERARTVLALAMASRDAVREALAKGLASAARALSSLGSGGIATAKVLAGVVNVAIAVAGFRYEAAADADEEAGREPLALDPTVLARSARGEDDPEDD